MVRDNYQSQTVYTAIYPYASTGNVYAKLYVLAGLTSECGELLTAPNREMLISELGDIMWYLARMCTETKAISFVELLGTYSGSDDNPLVSPTSLVVGLSQIADVFKKEMRDGAAIDDVRIRDNNTKIIYGMSSVLSYALRSAHWSLMSDGSKLSVGELVDHALLVNMAKLNSRKSKGTIGGSGDVR